MPEAMRRYHHGDLCSALLTQAEQALERGAEVNMRELARDVGVSPAAPFRHFADKRALVDALARQGFERLGEALDAALASGESSFTAQLTAVARAYVRFAVDHPALLQAMFTGKQREPALARAAADALKAPLALVGQAQDHGELIPGEHVQITVCATLDGIASQATAGALTQDATALDGIVDAAVSHLLGGLRPR